MIPAAGRMSKAAMGGKSQGAPGVVQLRYRATSGTTMKGIFIGRLRTCPYGDVIDHEQRVMRLAPAAAAVRSPMAMYNVVEARRRSCHRDGRGVLQKS